MKDRILLLSLALLAAALPAAAGGLLIGPRFSLGHSFDYGSDYRDYLDSAEARRTLNINFSLGVFAEISLSPLLALQPELMFTESGHRDYSDLLMEEYRSTTKHLETVLLAKLIIPAGRNSLQIFAGPDLRYGIGTWDYDIDDVTIIEPDRKAREAADIRNTYLGIVAGAGIRLPKGYNSLQLDARGYLSLQNNDATDAVTRKPAALWLNLGYGFSLEKRDRSARPVRFKKVSPREMRVDSSENIAANPFFSAYIASGYIEQLLRTHALRMDILMGSGAETRFKPFDMKVYIVEPVEIRSGHKHPDDGIWMHRFRLSRGGKTRTYNLWFVARKRQEPRHIAGIMGTTRANMEVQYDLVPEVVSAASKLVKNPANRTARPFITDSQVIGDPRQDDENAWREEWMVRVGSETITVEIDFNTGPFGIINYELVSE
jgi:hypothetical protein